MTEDVMEEILVLPSNGFITTISLIKLAPLTKLLGIQQDSVVVPKLNAKIVPHRKVVGHNQEQKYMVFPSLGIFQESKT
jgi:hypothetical protein